MKFQIVLSVLLILLHMTAFGQEASVRMSGADTIAQGEIVDLVYSFENMKIKSFELPEMVGFKVVAGPSTSSSVTIVNGDRSSLMTYRYKLVADQAGMAYIPKIKVKDGKVIRSTTELRKMIMKDESYDPSKYDQALRRGVSPPPPARPSRPKVRL